MKKTILQKSPQRYTALLGRGKMLSHSDLEKNVHQAVEYFGSLTIEEIVKKLEMRQINVTEDKVRELTVYLINKKKIRVSDYDASILVPRTE